MWRLGPGLGFEEAWPSGVYGLLALTRLAAVSWLAGQAQSTTAPPVKLISLAVMVRAQSDAAKTATLATSP